MEQTILSKRNCHRVAVVRNIKNPEWGTWAFQYKGQDLMQGRYAHVVGTGSNSKVLHTEEMGDWEVVSWKYDVNLDEYWDAAYRAFYWTSFNPDRAGERTIIGYEQELTGDLKNIPLEEQERYIANYKKHFHAWLSAHSRCASSAITGGSGFNVRRAEKANNAEHNKLEEFIQWREKALKAIAKRIENSKPEEQKQREEWIRLEKDILHSAAVIHGINTGVERGYHKALFVSSIYGKVETFAKRGDTDMVQKAVDCIRNFNETMSVVITERHKFFKLLELAETVKEKQVDKANQESIEIAFDGGTVLKNYSEDRLQILFDSKPTPDVISNLKGAGFRWSPRFMAWQRQLTPNAYYAAAKIIPVTYEQLANAK